MSGEDDRPIYSDTGYFTRGRSGFRPGPQPSKTDALWSLLALVVIGAVFGVCVAVIH